MEIKLKEYCQFLGSSFTIPNALSIGQLYKATHYTYVVFVAENTFWAETPSWKYQFRSNLSKYTLNKENLWEKIETQTDCIWDGIGWKGKHSAEYIATTS